MDLPVLFIIFNRPEIAKKSFEQIKNTRPNRLFIASDGPRKNITGEKALVEDTRKLILDSIDWECEVYTLFRETNLGCGLGVFSAINWFFENVEFGVILEDDCVAQSTFFEYAYQMLIRYRDDDRIGMISGTNPIALKDYPYSIIFSKYKSCWGWGTWRRAWKNMDMEMSWRNKHEFKSIITNCGYKGKDKKIWQYKLRCIDKGVVSAWDWQWYFSLSAQNQLCIYPIFNQISNIGDDAQATHTSFSNITIISYFLKFPLVLPEYVCPNMEFDKKFYALSTTLYMRISRWIPHSIKRKLKTVILKCQK